MLDRNIFGETRTDCFALSDSSSFVLIAIPITKLTQGYTAQCPLLENIYGGLDGVERFTCKSNDFGKLLEDKSHEWVCKRF